MANASHSSSSSVPQLSAQIGSEWPEKSKGSGLAPPATVHNHEGHTALEPTSTPLPAIVAKAGEPSVAGPSRIASSSPTKENGVEKLSGGGGNHEVESEEEWLRREAAARVAARLAADHAAVLNPDVNTPFADIDDVIKRLLPYHVYQHPKEDIETFLCVTDRKGKRKAVENDIATEIAETRFALECAKRKRNLEKRFERVLYRDGKRSAPSAQTYTLACLVLESDRQDMVQLNAELRQAKNELERLERERRYKLQRQQQQRQQQQFQQQQQQQQPAKQFATTGTSYYHPFAYMHPAAAYVYGAQYASSNPNTAPGSSMTSTFPTALSQSSQHMHTSSPSPHPTQTIHQTTGLPTNSNRKTYELPLASVTVLHALGIFPSHVSTANAQPIALVKGASSDNTRITIEFDFDRLQSSQINGLNLIVSALMQGGLNKAGVGVDNGAGAGPDTASTAALQTSFSGMPTPVSEGNPMGPATPIVPSTSPPGVSVPATEALGSPSALNGSKQS